MADFAKDYALGEEFVDAVKQTVYTLEAISGGDPLRIDGVRASDNTLQVRVQTAGTDARYIALRAAAANTYVEVLFRGHDQGHVCRRRHAGKHVRPNRPASSRNSNHAGTGNDCGFIISNGAAAR